MKKIKTIFIGTPEFAVPTLQKLVDSPTLKSIGINVVGVISSPDRPADRGQKVQPTPVKSKAQELKLAVFESRDIDSQEEIAFIGGMKPDLMLLLAFGQVIPRVILDMPYFRVIGIHPSLLPRWRGATPIQASILAGDETTGITLFQMDEKFDHGAIIASETIAIEPADTYLTLSEKLSRLSADLVERTLPFWIRKQIKPLPQDETQATYAKILTKDSGQLLWIKPARELERQIRAYVPWPGSWFEYQWGSRLLKIKVLEAGVYEKSSSQTPGQTFLTPEGELAVWVSESALILKTVRPEGKPPMSAKDFIAGRPEFIGIKLL